MSRATRSYNHKVRTLAGLLRSTETSQGQSEHTANIHRVFSYFTRVCSTDERFSADKRFMHLVVTKLMDFSLDPRWGDHASNQYYHRICLRSPRVELCMLRTHVQRVGSLEARAWCRRRHWVQTVVWMCKRCPSRAFRHILEYVGPYWNCALPALSTIRRRS